MALISYLITMFAGMFWIFRVVVAVTSSVDVDLGFPVSDITTEVVMLFVALFCLVLIVRRKILGAILYLVSYGWYFGGQAFNAFMQVKDGVQLDPMEALNAFTSLIGVFLALATFVDIAINKNRKGSTRNKKTDWFYKNEEFDREFDERADRNNYKF